MLQQPAPPYVEVEPLDPEPALSRRAWIDANSVYWELEYLAIADSEDVLVRLWYVWPTYSLDGPYSHGSYLSYHQRFTTREAGFLDLETFLVLEEL